MEQAIISGIAHDTSEAKVTISGVPDRPGIAARVFRPLADAGVNIDMIVQNVVRGRPHGHLVHAAEDGPAAGRADPRRDRDGRRGRAASRRTRTSRRSRSSVPA